MKLIKQCIKCFAYCDLSHLDNKVWDSIKDFNHYRCQQCYDKKMKQSRRSQLIKKSINSKISANLRIRVYKALKQNNKSLKTLELLGCTIEFFKEYLESKFLFGMSWENYGVYGWHIDHIKPCASFDLSDPKQQQECFHYTNLQPLWAIDNLKKGKKLS
jgi:hypothetical protein